MGDEVDGWITVMVLTLTTADEMMFAVYLALRQCATATIVHRTDARFSSAQRGAHSTERCVE